MPKQPTIPGLREAMKKKVTRREMFLTEMDVNGGAILGHGSGTVVVSRAA